MYKKKKKSVHEMANTILLYIQVTAYTFLEIKHY